MVSSAARQRDLRRRRERDEQENHRRVQESNDALRQALNTMTVIDFASGGIIKAGYLFRYRCWYHRRMPALNLTFTEDEMNTLRAAAAVHQVSLKTLVHDAALNMASEHRRRVIDAAHAVADRSSELNRRLA